MVALGSFWGIIRFIATALISETRAPFDPKYDVLDKLSRLQGLQDLQASSARDANADGSGDKYPPGSFTAAKGGPLRSWTASSSNTLSISGKGNEKNFDSGSREVSSLILFLFALVYSYLQLR